EVEMDQFSGTLTVCLPYSTIEPIIGKLKAGFQSDQLEVDLAWIRRLRERLAMAEVGVKVKLGDVEMPSREFLHMRAGDVLSLDTDVSDELTVYVGGVAKFKGFPGVVGGNKAVRISHVIPRRK
ncbi:MAG: FliM/FliN family flagellar motor switch protein, partial [Nitrospinae bacterium]|nr:FliM/FliN family flagellar motor switch protein [Nitrospinota bacterium]